MDNTTNPQNEHNASDRPAQDGSSAQAKEQSGKRIFDSIGSAMRRGAEEASSAAGKAIPKLKSAAADAIYWAAFGVSFAAVFQWTVARKVTPEFVKSGCRDGVKAGRAAAEDWVDALRQRKEKANAPSPGNNAGPSTEQG